MRREGFDAVYREYRDLVFRLAVMYTHNPDDAEDITQEVFVRYYIYSEHSEVRNVRSWLLVTTRNLANNHLKHAKYVRLLSEAESLKQRGSG